MKSTLIFTLCLLFTTGCTQEIIEPELFGSVNGKVINSKTEGAVSRVSIETTPATEAILTIGDGSFKLNRIPIGKYVIKASREGFASKSVNIMVREDRTTTARIVLSSEGDSAGTFLEAEVTSWVQTGAADSSSVEVDYRLTNISSSTTLNHFEIYFNIYNNGQTIYYEVADTTLNPGESNIGGFKKFVRNVTVDSVVVSGTWVKG